MMPRIVELSRFVADSLTCTGRLSRVSGVTTDPWTGEVIETTDLIFDGPCLIYPDQSDAVVLDVGEASVPVTKYAVTIPAGVDVLVGDVFEVTASPDLDDLVGMKLRITAAPLSAWQVALTCTAEAT